MKPSSQILHIPKVEGTDKEKKNIEKYITKNITTLSDNKVSSIDALISLINDLIYRIDNTQKKQEEILTVLAEIKEKINRM